MRLYLICPVRDADAAAQQRRVAYVRSLQSDGHTVYWSPEQQEEGNSDGGFRICVQNFWAMLRSHEVHIMFDPGNEGMLFDLGMLFALMQICGKYWFLRALIPGKRLVVANPEDVAIWVEHERSMEIEQSFVQLLYNWADFHRM